MQVPIREYIVAALYADTLLPQNRLFFLPKANGLIAFSIRLL
ncbi:hypothetical protein BACPLE_00070 [Phocaeicola plebeius DSM 17135]|uniref:Uncharacterized protein n=1 Tax=Phocaeicola plebeius (strain DSM 17135 / JCM 12973 / CCUG 54634 / M2) TaxID=484018 RepID=B5CTY6_PHOPM|nr:hypothetical protein BACPLE_00070 [Phocaeicola plebeius DSM 17135]